MQRLCILLISLCFGACMAMNPHGNSSLNQAKQLFFQHQLEKAFKSFEVLSENAELPEDRQEAMAWLALFEWRYYQRTEDASQRLTKGLETYPESSSLWIASCRLGMATKHHAKAIKAGRKAVQFAEKGKEQRSAKLLLAEAGMQASQDHFWETGKISEAMKRDLAESVTLLQDLLKEDPSFIDAANLLIIATLLIDDVREAIRGWQAYYEGLAGKSPFPQMIPYEDVLKAALESDPNREMEKRASEKIIEVFLKSRMFTAAAILATQHDHVQDPTSLSFKALTYHRFLKNMQSKTDEYYRLLALDKANFKLWQGSIISEAGMLWNAFKLGKKWPAPEAINDQVFQDLQKSYLPKLQAYVRKHFGAYYTFGKTAGYEDLHYGHIVHEETQAIEQYGHSGEITFLILDHMTSNGFQSWAWDFHMQHGGWATSDTIIQIRSDVSSELHQAWLLASDAETAADFEDEIRKERAQDLKLAQSKKIVHLPGVAKQMRLDGLRAHYAHICAKHSSKETRETAFKESVRASMLNAAIFAHEGRHVIDKRQGVRGTTELEYRAKLSEIAFADNPKLSMVNNIFASNLGAKTPHGIANKRVMKGIKAWMEKHSAKIKGFDANQPVLLQLPLLTDEQLRESVRSVDPLAQKL